jgi:hypothetical protein
MIDMQAFEPLLGAWTTEAMLPGGDAVVHGEMTVEWLEGGGYLIQRSWMEDPVFPRGVTVIGPDQTGERIVQHYFDSRGVARIYDISLENGVLRLWRDDPDFAQRFTGRFTDDGSAIEGAWERRDDGDDPWVHDFAVTYRRRG